MLVLIPLALVVVGCRGVEWPELGVASERDDAPVQDRDEARVRNRVERKPTRQKRQDQEGLRIVARSNREVAQLRPEDVVQMMQRVGFSNEQILGLGTDLYRALALSGGAELYYGQRLEMIFAVYNQQVHIQSRQRGAFVYDVVIGRFVLGSASSDRRR